MTALLINDGVRKQIAALIAKAEAKPIPLSTIMAAKFDHQDQSFIALKDRKPGFERPQSMHMLIPFGIRVALSIEEQPAGWCKHLSISVKKPGALPNPQVIIAVANLFDIPAGKSPSPPLLHVWLEEFAPGHSAVNLLYVYKPKPNPSHAQH